MPINQGVSKDLHSQIRKKTSFHESIFSRRLCSLTKLSAQQLGDWVGWEAGLWEYGNVQIGCFTSRGWRSLMGSRELKEHRLSVFFDKRWPILVKKSIPWNQPPPNKFLKDDGWLLSGSYCYTSESISRVPFLKRTKLSCQLLLWPKSHKRVLVLELRISCGNCFHKVIRELAPWAHHTIPIRIAACFLFLSRLFLTVTCRIQGLKIPISSVHL